MMYNECTVVKYVNLADTIYTVAHHPSPHAYSDRNKVNCTTFFNPCITLYMIYINIVNYIELFTAAIPECTGGLRPVYSEWPPPV